MEALQGFYLFSYFSVAMVWALFVVLYMRSYMLCCVVLYVVMCCVVNFSRVGVIECRRIDEDKTRKQNCASIFVRRFSWLTKEK